MSATSLSPRFENRDNVSGLQGRIIFEHLFAGCTGGKKIEDVLHTNAQARTTAALVRIDGNSV